MGRNSKSPAKGKPNNKQSPNKQPATNGTPNQANKTPKKRASFANTPASQAKKPKQEVVESEIVEELFFTDKKGSPVKKQTKTPQNTPAKNGKAAKKPVFEVPEVDSDDEEDSDEEVMVQDVEGDSDAEEAEGLAENEEDSDDDDDEEDEDEEEGDEDGDEDAEESDEEEEVLYADGDDEDDEEVDAQAVIDEDDDESEESEEDEEKQALRTDHQDRTIFIGNIPKTVTMEGLKKVFEPYGTIEASRSSGKDVMVSNNFQKNIDTYNAYIRFANKEDAERAAGEQNGRTLQDRHMRVTLSEEAYPIDNKRTLFVGNLAFQADDEDLWKAFSSCGDIESVRVVRAKNTNLGLGIGFVNFKSADSVELAMQMGQVFIYNRPVRLDKCRVNKKAETVVTSGDSKSIFVTGFLQPVESDMIKHVFSEFGEVKKVRLIKNRTKTGGGRKTYCFITFDTVEAAQAALKGETRVGNDVVTVLPSKTTLKDAKKNKANAAPVNPALKRLAAKQIRPSANTKRPRGDNIAGPFYYYPPTHTAPRGGFSEWAAGARGGRGGGRGAPRGNTRGGFRGTPRGGFRGSPRGFRGSRGGFRGAPRGFNRGRGHIAPANN